MKRVVIPGVVRVTCDVMWVWKVCKQYGFLTERQKHFNLDVWVNTNSKLMSKNIFEPFQNESSFLSPKKNDKIRTTHSPICYWYNVFLHKMHVSPLTLCNPIHNIIAPLSTRSNGYGYPDTRFKVIFDNLMLEIWNLHIYNCFRVYIGTLSPPYNPNWVYWRLGCSRILLN